MSSGFGLTALLEAARNRWYTRSPSPSDLQVQQLQQQVEDSLQPVIACPYSGRKGCQEVMAKSWKYCSSRYCGMRADGIDEDEVLRQWAADRLLQPRPEPRYASFSTPFFGSFTTLPANLSSLEGEFPRSDLPPEQSEQEWQERKAKLYAALYGKRP